MNYQYRKKPVIIEAFQMTKARRWNNSEWPNWLHEAWNKDPGENALWINPDDPKGERLACGTLEGVQAITWGDFILQGVTGEIYPCKSHIFEMIYEKVE